MPPPGRLCAPSSLILANCVPWDRVTPTTPSDLQASRGSRKRSRLASTEPGGWQFGAVEPPSWQPTPRTEAAGSRVDQRVNLILSVAASDAGGSTWGLRSRRRRYPDHRPCCVGYSGGCPCILPFESDCPRSCAAWRRCTASRIHAWPGRGSHLDAPVHRPAERDVRLDFASSPHQPRVF